jgi:hypothetical protein
LIVIVSAVISVAAGVARLRTPGETLRGLQGVAVAAGHRDSGDVLPPPEYEASVKSRLRAAGIPILSYDNSAPGHPVLWVIIGDMEDRVDLELRQDVVLDRNREIKAQAATWWAGFSTRSKDPATDPVLNSLVDKFIHDYRDANQTQKR